MARWLDGSVSPETVAGWQVGERAPGRICLDASSWFLTARLAVLTGREGDDSTVSLATFIHDARPPVGRVVWGPLATVHRSLVPRLLCRAESRLR